jgi:hypothetical protein
MRAQLCLPCAAAVVLACCSSPTEPLGALNGVWMLDSATAGVPPREMTLVQTGTRVTGVGTAMGVDVPIPVSVTGSYVAPNPAGPASVTLAFTFDNGGGITALFTGTLSAPDQLDGEAVYFGIFADHTVTGRLKFIRPPGDSLATGLEGTVTRGPVTPVCLVGVPCDAPFSAAFTVRQGGLVPVVVARFRSDSAGHYRILLPPATYIVVPDSGAPVFPGQSQQVTVGPVGMTHADLAFDTGIR